MRIIKRSAVFLFIAIIIILNNYNYLLYCEVVWQEHSTNHFIIYYHKEIAEDYIKQVATKAEEYYHSIAANLGFNRYDFWLWDNRAKIYIFKDAGEYHNESNQPNWSGGSVLMRRKIIKTYPWVEGFFDKLLPHELGHIMFREFVGFKDNVPLWLDEGVAILQENSDIRDYSMVIKRLRRPIPIDKLHKIMTGTLIIPAIFYAQSASIVDYLLSQFGKENFVKLCKYLKDGKRFEEAIESAYHFKDLKELDQAWMEYLKSLKKDN
jgi:hypothetical protein